MLYEDCIDELSTSSPTLRSLTNEQLIEVFEEIQFQLKSHQKEWSSIKDWTRHEAELLGVVESSNEQENVYCLHRFSLASSTNDYINSAISSLKYNNNSTTETQIDTTTSSKTPIPPILQNQRKEDNGQVDVYGPIPMGLMAPGTSFEVWTMPKNKKTNQNESSSHKQTDVVATTTESASRSNVTLILGAGNQPQLSMIDTLDSIFKLREPVLLKHHPNRPWLIYPYGIICEPLIKRGYFRQVLDEGVPNTKLMLTNPSITHVHITGSIKASNSIKQTLLETRPNLSSEIVNDMVTSELGCVTPAIVTKGNYTDVELQNMITAIITGKKSNGGCNCLSYQVVVMPEDWDQKEIFKKQLEEAIKLSPTYPVYYPGSRERRSEWEKNAQQPYTTVDFTKGLGSDENDRILLVDCGVVGTKSFQPNPFLKQEAFGPILAMVEVPTNGDDTTNGHNMNDPGTCLSQVMVPYVNNPSIGPTGTLSCTVFVPGEAEKIYKTTSFQDALSKLDYGTICVNQLTFLGYLGAIQGGVWGAHPMDVDGHSGHGFIGNHYGIPNVAKQVVYGPSLSTKPILDINTPFNVVLIELLMGLMYSDSGIVTKVWNAWTLIATTLVSTIFQKLSGVMFGEKNTSTISAAAAEN